MRKNTKAVLRNERLITAVISVFAGIGMLTFTAVLLSAVASLCDLPDSIIRGMSGIALAAGCFACAFCCANRRRRGGFASGLLCGAAVFAAVLAGGSLTVKAFTAGGFFVKLAIIISASAIGGINGVNTKPLFR
ncbi:MAG: TIGR04086 family membrane protein [Oscillospiraceae bacterium]|nr:TIGR04086 family membrane protein [Oscillospiraceae bacterium]